MTTEYNTFELFPDLSYNCITYLIDNNELIWRLLSYTDVNAYRLDDDHPNLTKEQKGALVYNGIREETDCRVFMDSGQEYSWNIRACFLRITPVRLRPSNNIFGYVSMGFEIYCHYGINQLSNYKTRLNIITQQLIETLNGKDVGGLGRLYFDARASSDSRMQIMGQIPYKANGLVMCNWIV